MKRTPVFIDPVVGPVYEEPGTINRPQPRHYFRTEGRLVWYHVWLAEKYLRPLVAGELVHHADGNPLNNEISNLVIVTRAEHIRIHTPIKGYKFTDEQRHKLSQSHMGQVAWNKGARGFKHSLKARANMSAAQRGRKITWGDKIAIAKTKMSAPAFLDFVKYHPNCTAKDIRVAFGLRSNEAIFKAGGLFAAKRKLFGENIKRVPHQVLLPEQHKQILALIKQGHSQRHVAAVYGVSQATIGKVVNKSAGG